MSAETPSTSVQTQAPGWAAMVRILAKREFLGYFRSPVAYVFLAVFLLALVGLAWFLGRIFEAREASLERFFFFIPWVFLFLIPAVGMRLWSEERRSGTWELLFTYPITGTQAVIGKFLAGWLFITLAVLLSFPLVLTLEYLGDPDWGPMISGYIGVILMAGSYLGICSLTSSLTKNQVISFVLSVLICLVLVALGLDAFTDLINSLGAPSGVSESVANFSFLTHFNPISKGLMKWDDIAFFLGLIIFSLWANVVVLER